MLPLKQNSTSGETDRSSCGNGRRIAGNSEDRWENQSGEQAEEGKLEYSGGDAYGEHFFNGTRPGLLEVVVEEESNEISAVRDLLDITNSIVTWDAMNTQKEAVRAAIAKKKGLYRGVEK
jgi:hypothetical protein